MYNLATMTPMNNRATLWQSKHKSSRRQTAFYVQPSLTPGISRDCVCSVRPYDLWERLQSVLVQKG